METYCSYFSFQRCRTCNNGGRGGIVEYPGSRKPAQNYLKEFQAWGIFINPDGFWTFLHSIALSYWHGYNRFVSYPKTSTHGKMIHRWSGTRSPLQLKTLSKCCSSVSRTIWGWCRRSAAGQGNQWKGPLSVPLVEILQWIKPIILAA